MTSSPPITAHLGQAGHGVQVLCCPQLRPPGPGRAGCHAHHRVGPAQAGGVLGQELPAPVDNILLRVQILGRPRVICTGHVTRDTGTGPPRDPPEVARLATGGACLGTRVSMSRISCSSASMRKLLGGRAAAVTCCRANQR